MVDFSATWQYKDVLGFVNERNETVKRYSVEDFEKWVSDNKEIPIPVADFDPMGTHSKWFGNYEGWLLETYIDDNFIQLTEDFYNSKNK